MIFFLLNKWIFDWFRPGPAHPLHSHPSDPGAHILRSSPSSERRDCGRREEIPRRFEVAVGEVVGAPSPPASSPLYCCLVGCVEASPSFLLCSLTVVVTGGRGGLLLPYFGRIPPSSSSPLPCPALEADTTWSCCQLPG